MLKTIGFLFFVGLLWVAFEIQTEGLEHAFGGVLAPIAAESTQDGQPAPRLSTAQSAGQRVENAQRENEERYERMLGE